MKTRKKDQVAKGPYSFDEKGEYKGYKIIGKRKSEIKNYLMWREKIEGRYKKVEKNFLDNFVHYLKFKAYKCHNEEESMRSIVVPLFSVLISLLIALAPIMLTFGEMSSEIVVNANSAVLEFADMVDAEISPGEIHELMLGQLERQNEILNDMIRTIKIVIVIVLIFLIIYAIIFVAVTKQCRNKSLFYEDYIEVLMNIKEKIKDKGTP